MTGRRFINQGFTLIELLIVIGIIGILAAVVLVGIDPVDKINAANDTKIQRDIQALATAMESYAVTHDGLYPTGADNAVQATLINNGDLKVVLQPPNYGWNSNNYAIWGSDWPGIPQSAVGYQLKSKKFSNTPYWMWCASSGKAAAMANFNLCP